jgi:signal transduction histidine kinase
VAEPCLALVRHQCEESGHILVVDIPADLPEIEADPRRVRQIVLNLASNAVKFTPAGGRIEIAARAAADAGIEFSVTDSGIGMRREDLLVALEPFRQVDSALSRKYEGTGLGLPLTKTLVELHNGSLEIESEPGAGTRVCVHLPRDTGSGVVRQLRRGAA